tara:strand:- start:1022 stop:2269 length:1248 start_codon:yes stop_codon:yes gene_type:complete
MGSVGSFEENDRIAAQNFGEIAKEAGVERIIYLGGLGNEKEVLSSHLRSRQEVGYILRASNVPVIEFRASIVIGSGSLSFEMIKSLVERLPVMLIPKWALMFAQPIAIDDLISYLMEALFKNDNANYLFEIGGFDQVSYLDIMRIYAKNINKRVLMIPVPVLTPYLSSLWLGLITPLYARIGRKLVESIVHSTVVRDDTALENFKIKPIGVEEAIQRAIKLENMESEVSRWYDSTSSSGETNHEKEYKFGERLIDTRILNIDVPAETAFNPIQHIGGEKGWYAWNILWQLRGFIDLLLGGVGMRRGRSHKDKLIVGGTIDFWRIEKFVPNNFLSLSAEMKLPGRAWLEFEVVANGNTSTIKQTAIFEPIGILGKMYWYSLYPLHQLIFEGMLQAIANKALALSRGVSNIELKTEL